ncbi:uncharacterized protein LOC124943101 [Impatiens glandulifera]|uniref:uncharacterized protein LOC124943101 n=1 Tax=Impatiens glandulifera TaxID=253017 RepID=UPI001FB14C27|nr:uncharacterized protein LOC124943101 [Impatiens glandulifera]
MDLDLALRIDQLAPLTDVSTADQRQMFEKWERYNHLSLMIIKKSIPEIFRGMISDDITKAEEFLIEIEKRFTKSDKAEMSTFLKSLITMRYLGKGNIREYILNMSNVASRLRALKLDLSEEMLVLLVLPSFLLNTISSKLVITVKRRNELLMNSFLTVLKRKKE